ncbi:MAG TPA: alpha-hydroxy-acid oxidizing protein [Terriglobia bacterium]|nr:alpha-hydroxy-acid oxidizing protein [Terriglobia bacterium]
MEHHQNRPDPEQRGRVGQSAAHRHSDADQPPHFRVRLPARAVLLGRPYLWGLAVAGDQEVREELLNSLADLDLRLALGGYRLCRELGPSLL